MKNLIQNLFIALACTLFSFHLFRNYYQPEVEREKEPTSVKLVINEEPPVNTKPQKNAVAVPDNFVVASRKVTRSVVNISTRSEGGYRGGSGSGVIVSADGFIATNNHVISGSSNLEVMLSDKRTFTAEVIGVDPTTDLALIKIDVRDLVPIEFGNSNGVEVGEWVLAVGNPFSLTSTVTAGIVSSKGRNINILRDQYSIESFIQTDAVVNPGNSGGALVNTDGQLVGINTAIITESGNFEGYSFAIPSNLAQKVIEDLRDYGKVMRAVLGVGIDDVTNNIANQKNLPDVGGVIITSISKESSAYAAGLKVGDVIMKVNGVQTNAVPELQEQVALFRPGDRISVEFFRDGKVYLKEGISLKSIDKTFGADRWE